MLMRPDLPIIVIKHVGIYLSRGLRMSRTIGCKRFIKYIKIPRLFLLISSYLPIPYCSVFFSEPWQEWWMILIVSSFAMSTFFCSNLTNKSVSSFEAHSVAFPGPILASKTYSNLFNTLFRAKILDVSALALNRSKTVCISVIVFPPWFLTLGVAFKISSFPAISTPSSSSRSNLRMTFFIVSSL